MPGVGRGVEEVVKGYEISVIRLIISEGLMYNMMNIVNNTVPCTYKLLRDLKSFHHKKKKIVTMCSNGCLTNLFQ